MPVLGQPVDLFPIPLGLCFLIALLLLILLTAIIRYLVKSAPPRRRPQIHGFDVLPPKAAPPNEDNSPRT